MSSDVGRRKPTTEGVTRPTARAIRLWLASLIATPVAVYFMALWLLPVIFPIAFGERNIKANLNYYNGYLRWEAGVTAFCTFLIILIVIPLYLRENARRRAAAARGPRARSRHRR